jgi:hypothetical protein
MSFITCTLHHIFLRDKIEEDEMAEHVSCMGEMRNACKILVRKPEGKRPLRRPRGKWENNIIMHFREISVGRCRLNASGLV